MANTKYISPNATWLTSILKDRNKLRKLYSFAYFLTNNQEDAEDLVHDVIQKLLTSKTNYCKSTSASGKAFLKTVIRNQFLDNTRKKRLVNRVRDEILSELLNIQLLQEASSMYTWTSSPFKK